MVNVSPDEAKEIAVRYRAFKRHFLESVLYDLGNIAEDLIDETDSPDPAFSVGVNSLEEALRSYLKAELER